MAHPVSPSSRKLDVLRAALPSPETDAAYAAELERQIVMQHRRECQAATRQSWSYRSDEQVRYALEQTLAGKEVRGLVHHLTPPAAWRIINGYVRG